MDIFKIPLLLAISFFGLLAANWGVDPAYRFHGLVIALVAFSVFIMALRRAGEPPRQASEAGAYCDDVIRAGVIATAFWGMAGFAVGVLIAFQLAFPALNFDWAQPYGNFGRLRPLHTSAVIFAFGGNALITTSFYIVQRTCGVRLWGGKTYWFVFWGYQLFIVLAATVGPINRGADHPLSAAPEWGLLAPNASFMYKITENLPEIFSRCKKSITICGKNICDRIVNTSRMADWLNDQPRFQGGKHEISI